MNDPTATDESIEPQSEPGALDAAPMDATGRVIEQDLVQRVVEAALFAATQPLTLVQLQSLFEETDALPTHAIEKALDDLAQLNSTRGVELVEVASGFRFQVRAEVHPWVSQLWAERQTRYSRALLETLALIAYRQPITRGEIEQIRGVAVSTHIIRTLEEREWVRVVGHRDVPGKPALFGTTRGFLDYFNLRSLDQLPPLGELHELPELEPELSFGPAAQSVPASPPAESAGESEHGEHQDAGHEAASASPTTRTDAIEDLSSDAGDNNEPTESDADASSEPHL